MGGRGGRERERRSLKPEFFKESMKLGWNLQRVKKRLISGLCTFLKQLNVPDSLPRGRC